MQFDPLDERLLLRPFGLRIDVEATPALPDSRHSGQRAEILQRLNVDIGRLGVDVLGIVTQSRPPAPTDSPEDFYSLSPANSVATFLAVDELGPAQSDGRDTASA